MTLTIPGILPNLNDYITAERKHRQQGGEAETPIRGGGPALHQGPTPRGAV